MLIVFFAEQQVTLRIERSYLLAQVARQRELQPPATLNEVIRAGMLHTRSLAEAVQSESERLTTGGGRRRTTVHRARGTALVHRCRQNPDVNRIPRQADRASCAAAGDAVERRFREHHTCNVWVGVVAGDMQDWQSDFAV